MNPHFPPALDPAIDPAVDRSVESTAGATSLARPNVLIVGAARAGSTFLVNQLTQHPLVATSNPKETHFLSLGHRAVDGEAPQFCGPGDDTSINTQIALSVADWENAFLPAHSTPVRIDASVSMLYYGEEAIKNVQRYLGDDVRVIVVLRDPVDRAYSAFKYLENRGVELAESFEDALDAEPSRMADGWHHLWHYRSMSQYAEQLTPWMAAFGDRLTVVDYDDLTSDSQGVCTRLIEWLGLNPEQLSVDDRAVNSSGELRSSGMQQLLTSCRNISWLQQSVKAAIPFEMRERIRSLNLRGSTASEAARARLMDDLEDDLAKLRDLLGPSMSPQWLR